QLRVTANRVERSAQLVRDLAQRDRSRPVRLLGGRSTFIDRREQARVPKRVSRRGRNAFRQIDLFAQETESRVRTNECDRTVRLTACRPDRHHETGTESELVKKRQIF